MDDLLYKIHKDFMGYTPLLFIFVPTIVMLYYFLKTENRGNKFGLGIALFLLWLFALNA